MRKIKSNFYDKFSCSADKCPITCCMEWKIAVDNKTYNSWKDKECCGLNPSTQVNIQDNGDGIIRLNDKKQCPFLLEDKLCAMVIKYGEDILSNTCHVFPRQTHDFEDRVEKALVMCCPKVVDLMKDNIDDVYGDKLEIDGDDMLFNVRNLMIRLVENRDYTPTRSLAMAFYIFLELYDKDKISKEELAEYESVTALKELSHGIDELESSWRDTLEEKNELFLDMVENYRKEGLYVDFLKDICLKAEDISSGYKTKEMSALIKEFDCKFAEYDNLLRAYLGNEIFTNMLLKDSDMESMIVMLQWITMEYVIIRHGIFLKWLLSDTKDIVYEDVRECIVIISRMTGYDEDDIFEYMENSFQSLIWEWGYAFLILGAN